MIGEDSILRDHPERLKRRRNVDGRYEDYAERLDSCEDFRDIFYLVKKSVKDSLGLERSGLMLYLMDLPPNVGAFHRVGSNGIVINRVLLECVEESADSRRDVNAFVYSILLHEYLHTLGCIDERRVRQLTYYVSRDTFGPDHIATEMAAGSPWSFIKLNLKYTSSVISREPEIVRDFETPVDRYIS